jgi:hypothetical protein
MCILHKYTRSTPSFTQFYIRVPFTLHVIFCTDQWILLKWFLLNLCIIRCSNWKSSAGIQFMTYSSRRVVCWDIAKTHLTNALYPVWWWQLMPPNTILLSSTRKLQLDREEGVPSFIAHHDVQLHKIIPLSPFFISPSSHQADIKFLT